jgi:site-specific DNA recombinase
MDWLDDVVWQHCLRFVNSPEILLKEIEREQQENQSNLDALEKEKQNTLLSIAAKDQERQNLISLYRKNLISLSEVEKQLTALEKEKSTLQERAKEIEQQFKDADNTFVKKESVEYILSTLREMLTEGEPSLEVKKTVIQCLVEKILVKTEIGEDGEENVSIRIKFRMAKFALPTAWSTLQDVSQTFCFTVNIEYSDAERYRCSHDLNTPATRLKWARLNAKLSHQQLSDMTGVTVAVISNTENGKSVPRVNISAKLSKALGQPVWYVGCYDLLPQNTFQEKMTKARCLRAMTKVEASKIIGVNVRTIYTWETEQYEPLPSSARAIEDFLGIL